MSHPYQELYNQRVKYSEFKESDHPREEGGQFTSGSGGSSNAPSQEGSEKSVPKKPAAKRKGNKVSPQAWERGKSPSTTSRLFQLQPQEAAKAQELDNDPEAVRTTVSDPSGRARFAEAVYSPRNNMTRVDLVGGAANSPSVYWQGQPNIRRILKEVF